MSFLTRLFNPVGTQLAAFPVPSPSQGEPVLSTVEGGQGEGASSALSTQDSALSTAAAQAASPPRPDGGPITTVRVEDLWTTHPSAGLLPQKLAAILNEADNGAITRAMLLAEEIEAKSPRILAGMRDRKLAVQQLDWTITPASDSREDKKIAEFVRKNLDDCDLGEAVGHMQDAIMKGFSALWINWRYDGEQIWLQSLDWTPQWRFTFAPRDVSPQAPAPLQPRILTPAEPIWGEELQQWRWLLAQDASRSTVPQRAGLWRAVVWSYLFANFAVKDWVQFLDTLGVPIMVGKYPTGMETKDIDVMKAAFQAFVARSLTLNKEIEIDIIESTSTAADMHAALARYCDEQISIAIVGQTASTQGTPGKLGNAAEQGEVRKSLIVADAKIRAREIRQQIIWPLVDWNFGPDKPLPIFRFPIGEAEDLEKKSQVYRTLVEIGVPITVQQAHAEFGIRPAEDDEPLLASRPTPGTAPLQIAAQADARSLVPDATSLQTDRLETDTEVAWNAVMDRVVQLVNDAESLPQLRASLLAAYGHLPTDQLTDLMGMAFAAAELRGRYDVTEETEDSRD